MIHTLKNNTENPISICQVQLLQNETIDFLNDNDKIKNKIALLKYDLEASGLKVLINKGDVKYLIDGVETDIAKFYELIDSINYLDYPYLTSLSSTGYFRVLDTFTGKIFGIQLQEIID